MVRSKSRRFSASDLPRIERILLRTVMSESARHVLGAGAAGERDGDLRLGPAEAEHFAQHLGLRSNLPVERAQDQQGKRFPGTAVVDSADVIGQSLRRRGDHQGPYRAVARRHAHRSSSASGRGGGDEPPPHAGVLAGHGSAVNATTGIRTRAHGEQAGIGSGQIPAGEIVDEADLQPRIDDAHAQGKRIRATASSSRPNRARSSMARRSI